MYRVHQRRWSIVILAAVALTAESFALLAQTPAPAALDKPPAGEPKFQPTQEQIGDSLMAHQRYQAALQAYQNAPHTTSQSWNKMGVAYQLMLQNDEASRCYRMAIKLDPKNAIVMNNMGSVFVAQKEFALAERSYRKAVKLDPKSALFHKNLGTALLAEHKYKKGWEAYQAAVALDPTILDHTTSVRIENPSTLQERGAMNFYMAKGCVRAGMNERAIEYLRMALNEGFVTPKKVLADSEFAALRDLPEFIQLMAAQGMAQGRPAQPSIQQ